MDRPITIAELRSRVENRVVYSVLTDLEHKAKRWTGGGALIHRVRAMGHLAETGARNIAEGQTPIRKESTFKDMRDLDGEMYDEMISFLYPIAKSRIYLP